ncbi:MAG: hypothetical protein KJ600_03545 [Nanoarchaeota archaeon]|nr:hypothetical protein [Nanoarchaeota archaeon]MBU1103602.1 hypothetical protein [Nanoarchaeota archaeon]
MKTTHVTVLLVILILVTLFSFVSAESNETEDDNETEPTCPEISEEELCPDQETPCPQTTDENECTIWDCDSCETTPEEPEEELVCCESWPVIADPDPLRFYSWKTEGECPPLLDGMPPVGQGYSVVYNSFCEESPPEPPEPHGNGGGGGGQEPDEPPYEIETCAAEIKITLNKNVYYYGDYAELSVEIVDAEGNGLVGYPFRSRIFTSGDGLWHTGESGETDSTGFFISNNRIEKGQQPPGKLKFKVTTAPNIKGCSPVENIVELEIKKGGDTEEVCGIGVCVPDDDVIEDIPEDRGLYACSGCELEEKCYPMGYRKGGNYCSEDYEFVGQLEEGTCENNFKCKTNLCIDGECMSRGLLDKVLNWLKKIAGGDEDEDDESGKEICKKLLIKKDIGDYGFLESESGYGVRKEAQTPLYSEDGEQIGSVKCCMGVYSKQDEPSGMTLVCPYDDREDVMNSLKGLSARGEIIPGEYEGEKVYRSNNDKVIVWTHKDFILATGFDPNVDMLFPEEIIGAYLKKYRNDLDVSDIPEGDVPHDPKPFVFCTEEDKVLAKECMRGGGNIQSDPIALDGTEEGKQRCIDSKGFGESCCEVYAGCTSSDGSMEYRDGAKEFLIKAETIGGVTLIDFESLPDGGVLEAEDRVSGDEWESLGVRFEAPSEDYMKVFGPLQPFNPLDKLSLSPGLGPYEDGSDTHDDLNIIFSEPVKAVGIYLLDLGETDERESITFLGKDGSVLHEISPWPRSTFGNPAPGTFVSFISEDGGIARIEILENTQDGDDIAYDNLYFVRR